jgi:hypothetical protein
MARVKGRGTQDQPWQLMTPPGTSGFDPRNNRMRALGKKR